MDDATGMWTLPDLRSRAQRAAESMAFVVGLVVFSLITALAPWQGQIFSVTIVLLLAYALTLLLIRRTQVDAAAGTVRQLTWLSRWKTVRLGEVTELSVDIGVAGSAVLRIVTPTGKTMVPLVAATLFGVESLSAEQAQAFADALETHVPSGVRGKTLIKLRSHATHLLRGGSGENSPLLS